MKDIIQKYSPIADVICCIESLMLSCFCGAMGAIVSEALLVKLFPTRFWINELMAMTICIACFVVTMRISIIVMAKRGIDITSRGLDDYTVKCVSDEQDAYMRKAEYVKKEILAVPIEEFQRLDFELEAFERAGFSEEQIRQRLKVNNTFKKVIDFLAIDADKDNLIPMYIKKSAIVENVLAQMK